MVGVGIEQSANRSAERFIGWSLRPKRILHCHQHLDCENYDTLRPSSWKWHTSLIAELEGTQVISHHRGHDERHTLGARLLGANGIPRPDRSRLVHVMLGGGDMSAMRMQKKSEVAAPLSS